MTSATNPPSIPSPADAGPGTSEHASQRSPAGSGGDDRGGPPGAYPLIDALAPPPRRRFLWRALLGCLIVLLASAGASAVAVLEQVHTIVQDISVNKPLKVELEGARAVEPSVSPETLLMVGDDTRSVFKYYNAFVPNLANEMLLVRIDPSKPWISMMSIPRELWVNITEPDGVDVHEPAQLGLHVRDDDAPADDQAGHGAVGQPRDRDDVHPVRARDQHARLRVRHDR